MRNPITHGTGFPTRALSSRPMSTEITNNYANRIVEELDASKKNSYEYDK